jgi:hypothetical protein
MISVRYNHDSGDSSSKSATAGATGSLLTRALNRLLPPPLPRGPTRRRPEIDGLSPHLRRDIGLDI